MRNTRPLTPLAVRGIDRLPSRELFLVLATAIPLAAIGGAAVGQTAPSGIALGPRTLAVGIGLAALILIAVTARRPTTVLTTMLLVAVAGSPRYLGGTVFVDTRLFSFLIAAIAVARFFPTPIAASIRDRRPERLLAISWTLILVGTVASTLASAQPSGEIVNWLLVGLVLLAVWSIRQHVGSTTELLRPVLVALIVVALGGVAQALALPGAPARFLYDGFEAARMDSFFGHPNGFAAFMALGAVISLGASSMTASARSDRALALLAFAGCLLGVMLSASRAAVLAVVIACVVPTAIAWLITTRRRDRKVVRRTIIAVVAMAAIGWFSAGGAIVDRFESGKLENNNNVRFESMRAAVPLLESDPVLGVGPHGFRAAVAEQTGLILPVPHAHNTLLTLWTERGLCAAVGFLMFACGSLGIAWRAAKLRRNVLPAMLFSLGATISIVITSAVDYIYDERASQVALWVLIFLSWAAGATVVRRSPAPLCPDGLARNPRQGG